jgi:hypothetical protein
MPVSCGTMLLLANYTALYRSAGWPKAFEDTANPLGLIRGVLTNDTERRTVIYRDTKKYALALQG